MHGFGPRVRAILAAGLLLASPRAVCGTSLATLDLREMAATSTSIVHGTVLGCTSRWNADRTLIVTEVRVRVIGAVKGSDAGEITLIQPGGTVGKLKMEVPGASAFAVGQETVLFLARDPRGDLHVTALNRGRFDVTTDEKTGQKSVAGPSTDQLASQSKPEGRSVQSVPQEGRLALEGFLGALRELVQDIERKGGQ